MPIAGLILGSTSFFGLKDLKKKMQDIGLDQNKETETIFNVTRLVSIGAIVIGAFKTIKWLVGM